MTACRTSCAILIGTWLGTSVRGFKCFGWHPPTFMELQGLHPTGPTDRDWIKIDCNCLIGLQPTWPLSKRGPSIGLTCLHISLNRPVRAYRPSRPYPNCLSSVLYPIHPHFHSKETLNNHPPPQLSVFRSLHKEWTTKMSKLSQILIN